jgi:hypothetical protein
MKKIPDIVKYVVLQSIGEITGQNYNGNFRLKVLLTHDDRFAIERAYKQMLPNDNGVEQEIKLKCGGIAELEQRIVEAPNWWKDSRNGRDLVDAQPIYDLLIQVAEKYEEWKQELKKEVVAGDNNVPS